MPGTIRQIIIPLLIGLVFFTALMGLSQGLVALNAGISPELPWFPLPALLIAGLAIAWCSRRWSLRLDRSADVRAHVVTLLLTWAALCAGVFEAWFHGLVLPAPTWPDAAVSGGFQVTFLIVLPFIAAVLAEVYFRGLMQTALEQVMSLWPMLAMLAVLNFLMHFYDPEQFEQFVRLILINVVWGYMTWRTQSLRPALVAHIVMNVAVPFMQYRSEFFGAGPVAFGEFPAGALLLIALTGTAALLGGLWLLRSLPARNPGHE